MEFDDFDSLFKHLQNEINDSLEFVGEEVKEVMQSHVQSDVYDHPIKPTHYQRTGKLKEDIDVVVGDGEVEITSNRYDEDDSDKYISPVIESGSGYSYINARINGVARPFVENTFDEIQSTQVHVSALENELKRKGFDVE